MSTGDERLVAQALAGELEAFNALVREHEHLAYNVALRMLGNPYDAADVTQDSFISAYEHLAGLRGPFRPWLLRIVVNRCHDALRRRRRSPASLDDADATAAVRSHAAGADPERSALEAELARTIERGLQQVPADQRAVVVLVDVQGLSYEETAAALRLPIGTVRSRLSRARTKLRDLLLAQRELLPAAYRQDSEG